MAIFNSYVKLPEGIENGPTSSANIMDSPIHDDSNWKMEPMVMVPPLAFSWFIQFHYGL